ncbi:penicillin-binding transpeptidase domain-containing protein [Gordonia liuliyuniae]|uniref:Penicillin-binding transpeptidase domain-containing protein n=1 Tax=Gordonia liuliyuniae TaxID=2911517 RepID=A0ABS9IRN4_9ACTN|nr:penicillin-binding transpeptidase domain-containing protein [Gordonia liuliyuniae]MCF8588214.1 penicillin-binding transpeptidase domain-containing protein [Gordonia liuliyuniae]
MIFRRFFAVLCVLVLVVTAAACTSDDDGPRSVADAFVGAFADHDVDAAAAQTTMPDRARSVLAAAWDGLAAESLSARTGRVRIDQDVADVDVTYTWTLPGGRTWEYDATLPLGRSDTGWTVRWSSTTVHPHLGADQRLVLGDLSPPRAAVNESDGSEVMVNGTVTSVSFDGHAAVDGGDVIGSATRLVEVMGPLVPGLSVQRIAEQATASDDPLPVGVLPAGDVERLRPELDLPGIVLSERSVLQPRDRNFASAVLTRVANAVGGDIVGKPGWQVAVVNPNGVVADVVHHEQSVPAPAVSLSLSRSVQDAAQRAVNSVQGRQAMTVAIQASTGKILAIAQNGDADRIGLPAAAGQYPPGSTFKMVTSAAAMNAELSAPDAMVACPGETTIGDRTIPNYDGFALGQVTLRQAFAASCNTTFAQLASRMGPSDLAHAAAAMGLGADYDIAGIESASGSVPIEPELVQRSEDGFGQGKVLASPLGMALVAATAATGTLPVPTLINGRETTVDGPNVTLDGDVYARLRPMMRAVVTDGTASAIAGQGEVFGKTGEAEVAGGSHAWFAGYRGDIAFATLIVLGGGSDAAVGITRDFLAGIPADFRP